MKWALSFLVLAAAAGVAAYYLGGLRAEAEFDRYMRSREG